MIPSTTMSELRRRVEVALRPAGVKVVHIEDHPPLVPGAGRQQTYADIIIQRMVLKRMGAKAMPVSIRVQAWGEAFEETVRKFTTGIDLTATPADAIEAAMADLHPEIVAQHTSKLTAGMVGIRRPLKGDRLLSIDHLVVDPDAIVTLVGHLGSVDAARTWVAAEMRLHRHEVENPHDPTVTSPTVRIKGAVMMIPFSLSPLKPTRDPNPGSVDIAPFWEDGRLYVKGLVPDMAASAMIGRRVGEMVSGTPVGHRVIERIVTGDEGIHDPGDNEHTMIEMETPRVRLVEAFDRHQRGPT